MSSDPFHWRSNAEHHDAQLRLGHLLDYYAWTLDLFGGDLQGPAADAGAGSGHFSELLSRSVSPLLVLEGGSENVALLKERFCGRADISVRDCDLTQCRDVLLAHAVRSIFTLDVLEHLPDDTQALREFHAALPPGGKLYIKVPALMWLYGPVDRASGHFRRYTKPMLRAAVTDAGFRIEKLFYMNAVGVAPYFVKSKILRKRDNFSRTFSLRQIQRIQRVMPYLRMLDKLVGPPVGLSLICIAHKA